MISIGLQIVREFGLSMSGLTGTGIFQNHTSISILLFCTLNSKFGLFEKKFNSLRIKRDPSVWTESPNSVCLMWELRNTGNESRICSWEIFFQINFVRLFTDSALIIHHIQCDPSLLHSQCQRLHWAPELIGLPVYLIPEMHQIHDFLMPEVPLRNHKGVKRGV